MEQSEELRIRRTTGSKGKEGGVERGTAAAKSCKAKEEEWGQIMPRDTYVRSLIIRPIHDLKYPLQYCKCCTSSGSDRVATSTMTGNAA